MQATFLWIKKNERKTKDRLKEWEQNYIKEVFSETSLKL